MIQKTFLILMLSCTGAGYFIGETEIGDSFPFTGTEFHQFEKKKSIPKPKSFYSKRRTPKILPGSPSGEFSFFPVLNDPSLSKMVGLNGEIIKINNFSPAPPVSARKVPSRQKIHRITSTPISPVHIEKAVPKIAVLALPASPTKNSGLAIREVSLKRNLKPFPRLSPLGPGEKAAAIANIPSLGTTGPGTTPAGKSSIGLVSYVVQVSAFKQWQHAKILKLSLEKKGYVSFIGKTELPNNRGTWYRVYIGRYFNRAGAERAATRFYKEENRLAMVIRQTG